MFYRLIAISIVFLLNACSDGDSVGTVNGKNITRAEFNRYLELKHVPKDDKRVELMLKDYMQREAYAGLIEKASDFDTKLVDAEVNEFRKQILISRYFEDYMNKKVSEEAIKNYYNT